MISLEFPSVSSFSSPPSEGINFCSLPLPVELSFGGRNFLKAFSSFLSIDHFSTESKKVNKVNNKAKVVIPSENIGGDEVFVKRKGKFKESEDLYSLLSLGSIRWKATDDQIRKGYHESCRKYHPDQSDTPDDEMFKKVQKAWEILGDKSQRILYDSAVDFEVAIPRHLSKRKKPLKFSKFKSTFEPLFESWRRWSSNTALPYLGGKDETVENIRYFYDQWGYHFKSWRDFSHLGSDGGMYDLLEADDRFERRWMVKENKKKEAKFKVKEREEIQEIVKLAQSLDPRYQNWIKKEKIEFKRMKKKKEDVQIKKKMIKLKEEERLRKIEEEKKLEEKNERRKQRKKKKDQEKRKKELEELLREICTPFFIFDKSKFTMKNKKKKKKKKKKKEENNKNNNKEEEEQPQILCEYFETLVIHCGTKELESCFKKCKAYKEKSSIIEMCQMINKAGHTIIKRQEGKQKEAEIERKKEKERKRRKTEESAGEWTREQLRVLMDCLLRFPSGTPNRFERISTKVGKTAKECQLKMKLIKREKPPELRQPKSFESPSSSSSSIPLIDENIWTNEQQIQFEKALRKFLKKVDPNKWKKIADMVNGKNDTQCLDHFKRCREIAMKRRKEKNN